MFYKKKLKIAKHEKHNNNNNIWKIIYKYDNI
jgi:hypothetical protein